MTTVGGVYCICGHLNDTSFMIQCDVCREWYHGRCIDVKEYESNDIEKYHCPKCQKIFGPPVRKKRTNLHRHDYSDIEAFGKPVQTGTPKFIQELLLRNFPSAESQSIRLTAQQLTYDYLLQNGFDKPILVDQAFGLGLQIPDESFSVYDVMNLVGPDYLLDVIDVGRQNNIKMTLKEWVDYFTDSYRSKVYNVISLEFSNTRMSELVKPPTVVQQLCWVANYWPVNAREYTHHPLPQVMKYCLMGTHDSYTDFHIDFGGTSVWYHVLKGEKVFYLVKPTTANLSLYERWMSSANLSETFFGDQADSCSKLVLKQGQTLFIPTGWIHAVMTTQDSLVFGGNFLTSLNIPLQLLVYDMEKRIKTPDQFRFPAFEAVTWFAAPCILSDLREAISNDRQRMVSLAAGVKAMITAFKNWIQEKDLSRHDEPPRNINFYKLIKDLTKELRIAEKLISMQEIQNTPKLPKRCAQKRDKFFQENVDKNSPSPIKLSLKARGAKDTEWKIASKKLPIKEKKSIYDFEDSDDDQLKIDEAPSNLRSPLKPPSQVSENILDKPKNEPALKIRFSFHGVPFDGSPEEQLDNAPKNPTINDLLLASSTVENSGLSLDAEKLGNHGNSPKTIAAIQGMLCMSKNAFLFEDAKPQDDDDDHNTDMKSSETPSINNYSLKSRSNPRRRYRDDEEPEDDFEESLKDCHQDKDYVYLGLDENSEDELHVFKPRGKGNKDDNWNPKAKLLPNLPKPVRPIREGTKKESIEGCLAVTAAKLTRASNPKRQYVRKKPLAIKTKNSIEPEPGPSRIPPSPVTPIISIKNKKKKKGFATPKQRLGKILKMHKMLY